MERKEELKNRDYYLNRLLSYKDTEPIKVITGLRRCGKSSLLKLLRQQLIENGVTEHQILYISFEVLQFRDMTFLELYQYIKARMLPDKKMYLILDEIQVIDRWEETVNSLHTEYDVDIYISGSNAKLLSSDLSTYLAGRYVELSMLPLSFTEYIRFHGFTLEEYYAPAGRKRMQIQNTQGNVMPVSDMLDAYLMLGGLPGAVDFGFDRDRIWTLIDGIYNTVVVRDILEHENQKKSGERKVTDPVLLKKIASFMADSIGSPISVTSIANTLVSGKHLTDRSKQGKPAVATVQAYVNALTECFLFYPVERYDIKGKEYLKTQKKYYIVDPGLRSYLLGYRGIDRGHLIENAVFLEFQRRGWKISIGKLYDQEIDFIIEKQEEKAYVQVTQGLFNTETAERELKPLRSIRDSFRKIVITEQLTASITEDGISIVPLTDFLLGELPDLTIRGDGSAAIRGDGSCGK